jgi:hypothetical protein
MLDKLFARYSAAVNRNPGVDYTSDKAVSSWRLTHPDSDVLTVLFPPWHGGGYAYGLLSQRLSAQGSAVLNYRFHAQILRSDTAAVLSSFDVIKHTVSHDIRELTARHGYKEIDLMASSLGNISLSLVASELDDFSRATMVVAGSNLARCAWEGTRTVGIRQGFETQGIAETDIDVAWAGLAPMRYADAFAGKPVRMYVSQADSVIPTPYQHEMVQAMQAAGALVDLYTSKLGHVGTIGNYCAYGEI